AALDNDLRYALGLPLRPAPAPALVHKIPQLAPEQAMPTLFGGGPATYPVRRKNFALSMAAHAAMVLFVVGSTLFVAKTVSTPTQATVSLVDPGLSDYSLPASAKKGS